MNLNLLIIGYCHLSDGFLYASKGLEKRNYKIYFFPYTSYMMDNIENRDDILIEYVKSNDIKVCLWWNNNIKYENYKYIFLELMHKNIEHIFFNWDPFLYNYKKYSSLIWKERIDERINNYPLFKHVFTCFEKEVSFYKDKLSLSSIHYLPPGFDKDISKYEYNEDFDCDVSIICTNMYNYTYEFPDESTNITRYSIVDKLYKNRDKIKLHIYGIEKFKNIYPDCYKGFISYDDCNKVFSNSKINLSIHPMINELQSDDSEEEYFSERLPQILGSKGLLMTNTKFKYKLIDNEDYIYIDNNMNWLGKIYDIMYNSSNYDFIRENGYQKALKYYQWDNWAEKIDSFIQK